MRAAAAARKNNGGEPALAAYGQAYS